MAEKFDLFDKVSKRLADPDIDQSAGMPDVPKKVRSFLGRLGILQQVPFYYLIPDERYLDIPTDNAGGILKLFQFDTEWIECLIDGALSVGEAEDRKILLAKAMAGNYVAEVYHEKNKEWIKAQMKGLYGPEDFVTELKKRLEAKHITFLENGQPEPTIAQNNWCYTGFLMRSPLISTWVGVEIIAKGKDPKQQESDPAPSVRPLQVIRTERIAADTLFVICEGIISQVEIIQPPEGFHFGFNEQSKTKLTFRDTPGVLNIATTKKNLGINDAAHFAETMVSKPLIVDINITWKLKK